MKYKNGTCAHLVNLELALTQQQIHFVYNSTAELPLVSNPKLHFDNCLEHSDIIHDVRDATRL